MRLLQIKADGTFSLVEYVGNNIPPYAILSHTWGADDEEVTFEDLKNGSAKYRKGCTKLLYCRQQAISNGLQLFWVDTCCIDKSSSAELSEAINSMFAWYQRAAECYVYLSDVVVERPSASPGNTGVAQKPPLQRSWRSSFLKSRWFTRGWTLQELLAPASVEFFAADGQRLGSKISLVQEIHEATGIPIQAIRGGDLSQFSVSERLSWAQRRETKREEDAAYCLLGIFSTHMPLIYGEGRDHAFVRLKRNIIRSSNIELDRGEGTDSDLSSRGKNPEKDTKADKKASRQIHSPNQSKSRKPGLTHQEPNEFKHSTRYALWILSKDRTGDSQPYGLPGGKISPKQANHLSGGGDDWLVQNASSKLPKGKILVKEPNPFAEGDYDWHVRNGLYEDPRSEKLPKGKILVKTPNHFAAGGYDWHVTNAPSNDNFSRRKVKKGGGPGVGEAAYRVPRGWRQQMDDNWAFRQAPLEDEFSAWGQRNGKEGEAAALSEDCGSSEDESWAKRQGLGAEEGCWKAQQPQVTTQAIQDELEDFRDSGMRVTRVLGEIESRDAREAVDKLLVQQNLFLAQTMSHLQWKIASIVLKWDHSIRVRRLVEMTIVLQTEP